MMHTQDELSDLERRMHELDAKDEERNKEDLHSRTRDGKQRMPERKFLLMDIRTKLDQQGMSNHSVLCYASTNAECK